MKIKKLFQKFYKRIKPFLTPKLIISFGVAWMITNGWAYILLGIGLNLNITWMKTIGGGYLALLWMPFTPEKLITIPIALFIHKIFFKEKISAAKITQDEDSSGGVR